MIAAFAHAALGISAAIISSFWEGVPIVAVVWLALRALPNLGAATRYAVWLCALAALFVVPVCTVWVTAPHAAATAGDRSQVVLSAPSSDGFARVRPRHTVVMLPRNAAGAGFPALPAIVAPQSAAPASIDVPRGLAVAIAMAWILAAGVRTLLLLRDLRELAALRRSAERWSNSDGYPIFVSNGLRVPLAAGFLHPAVLLPAALSRELSPIAVNAVVAHEVAHLRRLDVWTNALARVLEIFTVLNPLAWFIVRRLSIEREIACDDWVVARSGSAETFARTLAAIAGRTCARTPLAAPSALGSRHAVVERIERLLEQGPRRLRPSLPALGGALTFIAVAAFLLRSVSPVFAYSPQPVAREGDSGSAQRGGGACAVPNRPIQLSSSMGFPLRHPESANWYDVDDAAAIVARFTPAKTAVVDLTVNKKGMPQVAVVSAPPVPGLSAYVKQIFMHDAYRPAIQNCVVTASTVRTAIRIAAVLPNSLSLVAPSYPDGWSSAHPASCKVPNLLHTGVPAFPSSVSDFPVGSDVKDSARVTVDAAGRVTGVAIVSSSHLPAFDAALLEAARSNVYPLTESTGFKPVRPSNATLAWNAANGSGVYSKCSPQPHEYVWNTTFKLIVDQGAPGSTADASLMRMNF